MDVRLLNYWAKQAIDIQRKRFIDQAHAIRTGMAGKSSFNNVINELRQPVSRRARNKRVRNNWAELKAIGGG